VDGEALVRDYLGRLDAAAWPLKVDRRAELLAEVREHIETALAEAGQRDEVTVRNVLERLGLPEEIVAAEAEAGGAAAAPVGGRAAALAAASTWGAVEIIALLLLTVGAVLLPVIGPVIGLLFVWLSTHWTRREKVIATIIVAVLLLVPILGLLGLAAVQGGTSLEGSAL